MFTSIPATNSNNIRTAPAGSSSKHLAGLCLFFLAVLGLCHSAGFLGLQQAGTTLHAALGLLVLMALRTQLQHLQHMGSGVGTPGLSGIFLDHRSNW